MVSPLPPVVARIIFCPHIFWNLFSLFDAFWDRFWDLSVRLSDIRFSSKTMESSGSKAACREVLKMTQKSVGSFETSKTKPTCKQEHDFRVLTISPKQWSMPGSLLTFMLDLLQLHSEKTKFSGISENLWILCKTI